MEMGRGEPRPLPFFKGIREVSKVETNPGAGAGHIESRGREGETARRGQETAKVAPENPEAVIPFDKLAKEAGDRIAIEKLRRKIEVAEESFQPGSAAAFDIDDGEKDEKRVA